MARAVWKGHLSVGELSFAVALYAAATTSERISFHVVNRKTGNRVRRQYVDEETGKPVERDEQVSGYETSKGEYIILEPEEIASALPESDKRLAVDSFIACGEVDTVYFDRPYFIAPADEAAQEAFTLLHDGMEGKKVAALARGVLFRRVRTVLIRPDNGGFIGNTLNFDYEVRPAAKVFATIPDLKIKGEMLDLAKHIITTKSGTFDPAAFDDRYDTALAELVKAKIEGREIRAPKRSAESKVVDLMEALRKSAEAGGKPKKAAATPRRKAG